MLKMRYMPNLTHCILMDSGFWFDQISVGWSNVYIEGSQVIISN